MQEHVQPDQPNDDADDFVILFGDEDDGEEAEVKEYNPDDWQTVVEKSFSFLSSAKTKQKYIALVETVAAANPGIAPLEAWDKIRQVEKKYDHDFYGITYNRDFARKLVVDRNQLLALRELNLATPEQLSELGELEHIFVESVRKVADVTGDDPAEILRAIDSALMGAIAHSIEEAEKILIEGPIITGFEGGRDPAISNLAVLEFLKQTFGARTLRRAMLGRVTKSDLYLIYRNGQRDDHIKLGNQLIERGLATWDSGFLAAETREAYLEAEMIMEGVDSPDDLKHTYKIRASAGNTQGFGTISLHSFGIEQPQDFDYLSDVALGTEEDKKRAYILGTLSHEVLHRYEDFLPEEAIAFYQQIIDEEVSAARPKYVSNYVLRHFEVYGSNERILLGEDLAESVRIYTTNPNFLRTHFPHRFDFIVAHLSFIKPGSVVETVQNLSHSENRE